MKSKDTVSPLHLISLKDRPADESITPVLDASVLAKLASDVVAWNRQLSPSEAADTRRPARVARLDSLGCGLKILKKEESNDQEGELRRLFKE